MIKLKKKFRYTTENTITLLRIYYTFNSLPKNYFTRDNHTTSTIMGVNKGWGLWVQTSH